MKKLILAAAAAGALALGLGISQAADEAPLLHQSWSFEGPFGTYDRASLQRGLQVYKEVCSTCHAVEHLAFRDLGGGDTEPTTEGIGWTEDQVKAFASQYEVTDGPNDEGQMFQRQGRPADKFPRPFPNEKAARAANNGAYPPDLSLVVKAREGGPDYVFSILNGYVNPPPGFKLANGMNYNEYFPGHQIAMPKPLSDGAVTFADGTPSTVPQMAHDVASFLSWASEPTLEERHRTGLKVMIFLVAITILFYAVKRKTWAGLH